MLTMKRFLCTAAVAVLLVVPAAAVLAQAANATEDAFGEALFAPDLVMQHAREIGLTADQRTAITAIIQELQGKAVALQLQMVEEVQSTIQDLQQTRVNEASAIASTRRVLALEQDVKIVQLQMLIRIKNTLTAEQQMKLRDLRRRQPTGAR